MSAFGAFIVLGPRFCGENGEKLILQLGLPVIVRGMSYYSQLTFEEKHWLLEHARERYVAGETLDQLVASLPVSKATLHRAQVIQGWRRKDIEAQARGEAGDGKPAWLVKYEAELARVPSGVSRDIVNAPDMMAQLLAKAEDLPETLDITDMRAAAQKAAELAARYQLIGEVKLADAQARLAERFVRLAGGLLRVDCAIALQTEKPDADSSVAENDPQIPSLEELRTEIERRLEGIARMNIKAAPDEDFGCCDFGADSAL